MGLAIGIAIGVVLGLIGGLVARGKNRNPFLWAILCFIFPIALLIVAVLPRADAETDPQKESPLLAGPVKPAPRSYDYDRKKWDALIQFDPEIARAAEALKPHGEQYVHQLAEGYLTLNDKSYLPNIVQKVTETVDADIAAAKAEEARWAERYSDPAFLAALAEQKKVLFMKAGAGPIAILDDGQVLMERDGQLVHFENADALRDTTNDRDHWDILGDEEAKGRLAKLIAPQVPGMTLGS